jgi:hypothetical protein
MKFHGSVFQALIFLFVSSLYAGESGINLVISNMPLREAISMVANEAQKSGVTINFEASNINVLTNATVMVCLTNSSIMNAVQRILANNSNYSWQAVDAKVLDVLPLDDKNPATNILNQAIEQLVISGKNRYEIAEIAIKKCNDVASNRFTIIRSGQFVPTLIVNRIPYQEFDATESITNQFVAYSNVTLRAILNQISINDHVRWEVLPVAAMPSVRMLIFSSSFNASVLP